MSDTPTHRKEFSTWNEFVSYVDKTPCEMPDATRASRHSTNGEDYTQFTKAKSWDHIMQLARDGWPEGLARSKSITKALFDKVSEMIERIDVKHDIEGHAIDVSRYLDGEPECWLKFENVIQEAEAGHKLIKLTFNVTVSAGVSTEVIIRKGATISALVELLEYAGHRVELTIVDSSGNRRLNPEGGPVKPIATFIVRLKEFDQNLDMGLVTYALCHPSVARGLMFSAMELSPKEIRQLIGVEGSFNFYGTPTDIDKKDRGDIHIPHSYMFEKQWQSTELAEKWLIEELAKQGVHLKKENENVK